MQVRLRLSSLASLRRGGAKPFGKSFDKVFADRIHEAGEFYDRRIPSALPADARSRSVVRPPWPGACSRRATVTWCSEKIRTERPRVITIPYSKRGGCGRLA